MIFALGLLFVGACDDDDIVGTDPHAPFIPSDPTPGNGSNKLPLSVSLSWSGADPDDDPLTYDVYFGTTRTPSLVALALTEGSHFVGSLRQTQTYHWRVVAFDPEGNSISSPLWSFETDQQETDYIFPLALGHHWDYVMESSISMSRWDSIVTQPAELLPGSATIKISALDFTINSVDTAYRIDVDLETGGRVHRRSQVCSNEPDGLIIYQNWGAHDFGLIPRHDGIDFDEYFTQEIPAPPILVKDELQLAMAPPGSAVSLAYPLEVGSRWTVYSDPDGRWSNDKEVMGMVTRTVPAGTFQCYEVRWYIHVTEQGSSFEGLDWVDYVAREGLIERIVRTRSPAGDSDNDGLIVETIAHYKLTDFELR